MKRSDSSSLAMYGSVKVASKPIQNNEVAKSNAILCFRYMPRMFVQLIKETKRTIVGPNGCAI